MLNWLLKKRVPKQEYGLEEKQAATSRKVEVATKILERRTTHERREHERRSHRMSMLDSDLARGN